MWMVMVGLRSILCVTTVINSSYLECPSVSSTPSKSSLNLINDYQASNLMDVTENVQSHESSLPKIVDNLIELENKSLKKLSNVTKT